MNWGNDFLAFGRAILNLHGFFVETSQSFFTVDSKMKMYERLRKMRSICLANVFTSKSVCLSDFDILEDLDYFCSGYK
jgi:hypothetical protein